MTNDQMMENDVRINTQCLVLVWSQVHFYYFSTTMAILLPNKWI